MHILNDGQTIAIGDVELASRSLSLSVHQWMALFFTVAIAAPLAVVTWYDPGVLGEPVAAIQISAFSMVLMAILLSAKYFVRLVPRSGGTIAVIFDRVACALDVVFIGFFGTTRKTIVFAEIQAIRVSRGEWSGSSVAENTVVELASGQTIVLPEALSPLELNMLRVLTGLRRT